MGIYPFGNEKLLTTIESLISCHLPKIITVGSVEMLPEPEPVAAVESDLLHPEFNAIQKQKNIRAKKFIFILKG
jgi:hypothetical protein